MTAPFPLAQVRAQFPALALSDDGTRRIYFDNPAGTQVPLQVIERMRRALTETNANLGGFFSTSRLAGDLVDEAHRAAADFYNASSPCEIVFGQNMTTLTLHLSRCLARGFEAGDEIVLSRMDHDANVAPWLFVAEDKGLTVRWMDFDPDTSEFPDDALDEVLSERTRLVAFGYASNCTGTINDVRRFCERARAAGALTYIDAVQFAPHGVIDVKALGCDFLVSSAYKWFGPHLGILYGRKAVLEETFAYRVRPAGDELPGKFETGTGPRETYAGMLGALDYLASLGDEAPTRRGRLVAGMTRLGEHEKALTRRLISGLKEVKGLSIRGITSENALHRRVPTVSFTLAGHHPADLAKAFARANILVWSGHNYAVEPVTRMGLMEKGGVLRVGLAHYNSEAEVDALLSHLHRIAKGR
jgi:cysteine desulfurase family protein (TIGR01976 family)